MKGKAVQLSMCLWLIMGLNPAALCAGGPVNYLGKTTWTVTCTDHTYPPAIGQSYTLTGGVSKVGDEFYLFQGYVVVDPDGPVVVSGGGMRRGSAVVLTLGMSQNHTGIPWKDTGVLNVTLDAASLNGTMYEVGNDFDTAARTFRTRYGAYTLTLSGPPITISSGAEGMLRLLLE